MPTDIHQLPPEVIPILHRFVVTPLAEGGYCVEFPALPGCLGYSETLEAIHVTAAEIYQLWVEAAHAYNIAIPGPEVV